MGRSVALLAVLALHLAAAVSHGATHGLVPVPQPAWQNALVLLTTFLGPVAGVALARRDHPVGVPLFTVSMAGALALGGGLHFLLENPDHVRAIPADPWRPAFQLSALAVLLTPAAGVLVGVRRWATR